MRYCSEKCKNYKAQKRAGSIGRYSSGQKRCNSCEIFIKWNGLYCPCCNNLLKCSPRSRAGKEKYQEQILAKK